MEKNLEEILDRCLKKMKEGISKEDCLQEYPDCAIHLEGLLDIARGIQEVSLPFPSPQGLATTLVKAGRAVAYQKGVSFRRIWAEFPFPSPVWVRAFTLTLLFILISWGTASFSRGSIPGDFLYPIKIISEKVRFFLTRNPEGKVELRITFSEERMSELIKSLEEKNSLDQDILFSMLEEAESTLEQINSLPQAQQPGHRSKLIHLQNYFQDNLKRLKVSVNPDEKEELDQAIKRCEEMRRMCQMMGGSSMKRMHQRMYEDAEEDTINDATVRKNAPWRCPPRE